MAEQQRRYPMATTHISAEIQRLRKEGMKHPASPRDITTHEWLNRMSTVVTQARVAAGNNSDPRSRLLYLAALIYECLEADGPL